MIKDKKLPEDILRKLPPLAESLKADERIIALYLFGSAAHNQLKPLSDLDIAVLIDPKLSIEEIKNIHLYLQGEISDYLHTDEIDLIILNTAPPRFVHRIIGSGKLLFCNEKAKTIDFIEKNNLEYLDFKYYKDQFNYYFQKQYGLS